jgi:hypothetical protein
MRSLSALALLLMSASLAIPQEGRPKGPEQILPRYGVKHRGDAYTQATPKEALQSVIDAAEKGEFNYLVAHLLDPAFVDARLAERAKQFEPSVESNLADLRDFQQRNLDKVVPEARVPVDPAKFRERVLAEAKAAAFKQLARDVQNKFTEDPETLKDLRRFRSAFPNEKPAGDTLKVVNADVKDRVLFFKKISERWVVENRQVDEKAPEPMKEPEKK